MAAKMEIKVEEVKQLIKEKFHDNNSYFAKEIGMGREYVSAIINERKNADSPKFCNALIVYCEKNSIDYKIYVKVN